MQFPFGGNSFPHGNLARARALKPAGIAAPFRKISAKKKWRHFDVTLREK